MVKFTTICRSGPDFSRQTKFDIQKVHRNPQPSLHPLQKAREYKRALNAVKIDRIFAQPFIAALPGHSDGISSLATCKNNLSKFISGSYDGELRIWDIPSRSTLVSLNAHKFQVRGVCFSSDGMKAFSSSDDKTINMWDLPQILENRKEKFQEPIMRYLSQGVLGNVDHAYNSSQFATSGQVVQIWNYDRPKPYLKMKWGIDTLLSVRYCPSDDNMLCATSMDRCCIIYDIRAETPAHKVQMLNKSSCIAWNPIEPLNVTLGNDDSNCYTFDIRKMDQAKFIHKDHIQPVLSVSYSPTGQEFASGSFDKTIRIFPVNKGNSREVYHAQRMQQVNAVEFSGDAQWLFSGSNDMNIRIWKSQASQKIGVVKKREETVINYRKALKDRFQYNDEIKRIANHRHVPKYILNAKKKRYEKNQSRIRKIKNQEVNNVNQLKEKQPERKKRISKLIE